MIASLTKRKLEKKGGMRAWNGILTEELLLSPGKFGLGKVPLRLEPDNTTDMVCGFCSTGCGLTVHLKNARAINITPATNYPVNLGMACPKGWEALTPLAAADRATTPLLKDQNGTFVPVDWDEALQVFTLRFKAIQDRFGPASVAFISTGQMVMEEMAYLGALAKFGMGMTHGDGNTRQCMATAATAYKQSFGFDAPPFSYTDFEESDVIILAGSNLCIAHPILWQRILRNKRRPKIVVIDPRKTETAMAGTHHLAIAPKSDLILFYGLAREVIRMGGVDEQYVAKHTTGFEAFARHVEEFTPEIVSAITGLSLAEFRELASDITKDKRVSFWWTMGVNQSHEGTRLAQAIINLALITGNMGKPGTGANSITGQCNAMGSRILSNTTNLFGGRDFTKPEDREAVAKILGVPCSTIPQEPSWAYDQIIEGIRTDKIKGLWIIATNTLHSWIDQLSASELLRKLDFLVVQDMYGTTETAREAHLILPAAGWGEKEGTLINSERRIGLVKKVAKAPGEALSDFNIFKLVAHYWGCADLFTAWTSPEAVFQILKRLTAGRPCDFSGIIDYRILDEKGGIQWPFPEGALLESNERRMFEDGKFFHTDGRARLIFEAPRLMPEPPDDAFPFLLLTGRGSSAQWHTQTRTGKSEVLKKLYAEEVYVEINPMDAKRLHINPGEKVTVRSRRGSMVANAFMTPTIQKGQLFIPMHYVETNKLTLNVVDPYSRQPAYKACAVNLEKAEDL